jgi:hypothetical protein
MWRGNMIQGITAMRMRNPSFEFSGFFFGLLALLGFVRSFRAYWNGVEAGGMQTVVACSLTLLVAVVCFGWSLYLGNQLKRIREWRLPESGGDGEPR